MKKISDETPFFLHIRHEIWNSFPLRDPGSSKARGSFWGAGARSRPKPTLQKFFFLADWHRCICSICSSNVAIDCIFFSVKNGTRILCRGCPCQRLPVRQATFHRGGRPDMWKLSGALWIFVIFFLFCKRLHCFSFEGLLFGDICGILTHTHMWFGVVFFGSVFFVFSAGCCGSCSSEPWAGPGNAVCIVSFLH